MLTRLLRTKRRPKPNLAWWKHSLTNAKRAHHVGTHSTVIYTLSSVAFKLDTSDSSSSSLSLIRDRCGFHNKLHAEKFQIWLLNKVQGHWSRDQDLTWLLHIRPGHHRSLGEESLGIGGTIFYRPDALTLSQHWKQLYMHHVNLSDAESSPSSMPIRGRFLLNQNPSDAVACL